MLIPIVLSDGTGTPLWPLSREGNPKRFMKLSDGDSLLQKTYRRALVVMAYMGDGDGEPIAVNNRDYYFMSKDELSIAKQFGKNASCFLLEPTGRNTAPAAALAAHHLSEK
jgi:mannose-1-phosphate guanylyltransferase/mannose-6-phosphate isomerase